MATAQSKACTACKQTLPASAFSADRRNKSGLQSACKKCATGKRLARRWENIDAERTKERRRYHANPTIREKNNEWRKNNRDKVLEGKKRWYERVKETPSYRAYVKARQEDGRESKREYDKRRHLDNSTIRVAMAAQWNRSNPERRKAILFAYTGKRRSQTRDGPSGAEVRVWAAKQKKRCHWCGADCRKGYHVDHYVPLARGGAHALSNFVISCGPCNWRKNAKDPLDFAREIGKLL